MVVPGDEVFTVFIALVISIFVYGLLALYLYFVLPSDFGIQKPWHFIFTSPWKAFMKARRKASNQGIVSSKIYNFFFLYVIF